MKTVKPVERNTDMTITIQATTLAAALKGAAAIVETKNTLPILAMVMFDGKTITTSNLDIEYRQTLEADGELSCAVDANRLSQWANVAKGTVTMTVDGNILNVKAGRSRLALPALPIDDFPIMPVADLCKPMAISFSEIVKRTLWAASTSDSQAYLSGVFMNAEKTNARFVSTDGYRVASVTTSAKWPKGAADVILPPRLAKAIAEAGSGSLQWDATKARFTAGDVTITGKMIEGTFPDYRRLFSKVVGDVYAVDASELLDAVRRVRIASDAQQRKLRLTKKDGALAIRIEGTSGFEGEDEITADCADGFETGVNADFLVGMLSALDADSISVQHDGPDSAMYFRPIAQGTDIAFEGLLATLRI